MKLINYTFTIAIILLIISCGQPQEEKSVDTNQSNPTETLIDLKETVRAGNASPIEVQEKWDSLNNSKILTKAIRMAEKLKGLNIFKKKYFVSTSDSSDKVEVNLKGGFYFSNKFPHLIIRRKTSSTLFIVIFSKNHGKFQKVLSHEQSILEYTGDTITDINGDGLKDFTVNWYGATGCCLKAFSNVYLQRDDRKRFSSSLKFINPTFSPKEQIIRGICYGHPGETEMYKFKWNKESVDTVEYIYYEKNNKGEKTGKLIVSKNLPSHPNHKILARRNDVPPEYRKIVGYDWFSDNLEETKNR